MLIPPLESVKTVCNTVFYLFNIQVILLLLLPAMRTDISLWWLDNLLNLQLQWSLLAMLLLLINHFYFKRLTLLFTLIYVAVISYNLMPLYIKPMLAETEASTIEKKYLTVAQINLRYDNPHLAQLLPILGDKHFDLLIIQEASDNKHHIIKQLAQYYHDSFGLSSNQPTPDGMAIFSKWPMVEKKAHQLGSQRGHLLEVLLQKPGLASPIQLFALHPASPRTEMLWQLRNETLATSAQIIAASPFKNKIAVGDFNSSPWATEFRNFQRVSQLQSSANGFGYIASWSHSGTPLLSLLSSAYIDHQFISQAFNVLNKVAQPIKGSDHQMILTQLQIAN